MRFIFYLALLAAAVVASAVELREVCVRAVDLGVAGRGSAEVAFLTWLGDGPISLPYRVEAKAVVKFPLVFGVGGLERYAYTSYILPDKLKNNTVICISVPNVSAPPLGGNRSGELYIIDGAYVLITSKSPLDLPPAPVVSPRLVPVSVAKVGVVAGKDQAAEPYLGWYRKKALSNAEIPPRGVTFTAVDLVNATSHVWLVFSNATRPGRYALYYRLYSPENGTVYREGVVKYVVDGKSPYYPVISISIGRRASREVSLYVAVKNENPSPAVVDLYVVGASAAPPELHGKWMAGMASKSGYSEYALPVAGGYAALPIRLPPGGITGTEALRARLSLRICSRNATDAVRANVYVGPYWAGQITFNYSHRDGSGCAVYHTADSAFTGFIPTAYIDGEDISIGPLPAGSRLTVQELYAQGRKVTEPRWLLEWEYSSHMTAVLVANAFVEIDILPLRFLGDNVEVIIRTAIKPIVTPKGAIPLRPGFHEIKHYLPDNDIPSAGPERLPYSLRSAVFRGVPAMVFEPSFSDPFKAYLSWLSGLPNIVDVTAKRQIVFPHMVVSYLMKTSSTWYVVTSNDVHPRGVGGSLPAGGDKA
ncbi:hypothetical protein [Pyrobaculum aerophilum]|uniref:hypothetical protein n=1 Tax=Pyrobaculum aerophilum TaxID=13773 RepID=UPI002162572F|nr:hypothetical protein [Pyrobaculum aerophilum]